MILDYLNHPLTYVNLPHVELVSLAEKSYEGKTRSISASTSSTVPTIKSFFNPWRMRSDRD